MTRAWPARALAVIVTTIALCDAGVVHAENDDPILSETHEERNAERYADRAPFKFTAGIYHFTELRAYGYDFNLRHQSRLGSLWSGVFHGPDSATAWRLGWDRTFDFGLPRVTPSLQLAQGGFIGGSVLAEIGEPWFVGAGLGRTNLRPYVNLNFDPNDAITYSAGRRLPSGDVLALQFTRDNRQKPGDRHLHLFWRQVLPNSHRLIVDVLYKQGTVDDERIRRMGLALTYEWPRVALRAVWDPKVNFSNDNQVRVSVGWRF